MTASSDMADVGNLIGVDQIADYHAHVYFDSASADRARRLREQVETRFDIRMGRWHEKPVGPHPQWSYQIAFTPALLPVLIPWLMLNRAGLTVFVHPNTGNDLEDHTGHVMWLGESDTLNTAMFERKDAQ